MKISIEDPGLNAALETALGHAAPFAQPELEALQGPLRIRHARDLSGLRYCLRLEHLEIFASDLSNLDVLEPLKALRTLRVTCTPLEDWQALAACHALEHVEVLFTFIDNLQPLMALPNLRRGALVGNPWSPESYHELRPQRLRTPGGGGRPPVLVFSREDEWQLACKLHPYGACFGYLDARPALVRPGVPRDAQADCDYLRLPIAYLKFDLEEPDFSLEGVFRKYIGVRDSPERPYRAFDDQIHYHFGTAADAAQWVREAALPDEAQGHLLLFIRRFPSLLFYREDDILLNERERKRSIPFPSWLRKLRTTLAFVEPRNRPEVRYDGCDLNEELFYDLSYSWFNLGLIGPPDLAISGIYDEDKLLYSISENDASTATFAINLANPDDRRVYLFDPDDMRSEDRLLPGSANAVFHSYTHLFSHIVAIKLRDGRIVEASL